MSSEALAEIASTAADGLRSSLEQFLAEHPDEQIYSFGPYVPGDLGYCGVALFTEGGLATVTAEYVKDGYDSKNLKNELRWSPADSPFHCQYDRHLEAADTLLGRHCQQDFETAEGEYEDHWEARVAARSQALQDAIGSVDFDGLLGKARNELVVCIWCGDQSDEDRLRYVEALNPAPVFDRFVQSYINGQN